MTASGDGAGPVFSVGRHQESFGNGLLHRYPNYQI